MKPELQLLSKNGFIKFSCNSEDESTLEIAQSIGNVLALPGVSPVQTLVPNSAESRERSSYSGNFGMGAFPLHTDMAHWYIPPRYLLLRCIRPAEQVYTSFVSIGEVIDFEDPITFKRALFRPRRRLDGRLSILRLYDNDVFRWDPLFIRPINNHASALQARVEKRIANAVVRTVTFESSTDCILIHNWKVLHGRSSVPTSAFHRVVERVYLSTLNEDSHAEN
jgi:L-asparagine oxygenase